jgi:hypothetical protein
MGWLARTCVAAASFAWITSASAGFPAGWTNAELALTSPFCQDVQTLRYGDMSGNPSPNAGKWVAIMGHGFWAVHHYCWAQINLARAERPSTSPSDRKALRIGAINDMMYVVHNTPDNFILLPEIFTRIGQVELKLRRYADAKVAFGKAMEIKPDYWPAYLHWAEHLMAVGQKAEARNVAEDGFAHAPSSKTLRKLLVDLGGDPAKVKPRAAAGGPTSGRPAASAGSPGTSVDQP